MLALGERVPGRFAVSAQLGVGEHELGAGVDDFDESDPGLELERAGWAPSGSERAVTELGGGLE